MLKTNHRKTAAYFLIITGMCVTAIILILKAQRLISSNENPATRYPDGFETKAVRVGNQLVAFSSDGNCIKSPIVYIIEKGKSDFIFEVDIEGVSCVLNERFEPMDVDGDGENEIVSEWMGSNEGAEGVRGLVVWDLDRRQSLFPLAGYPEDVKSEESRDLKITVTYINTGKTYSFPAASDDFYTDYQSTNSGLKLNFGRFIWDFDAGESRNSPHAWELQRFKLVGSEFVKDASWHNGEKYPSEEKLPVENIDAKLKEMFNSLEKI